MTEEQEKEKQESFDPNGEEAVALSYDPARSHAPEVTAKGKGKMAEELLRLAVENNIPIKYDPDLVQILSKLDVGEDIPEEVYLVTAEILAFIYWVNQEFFFGGAPDKN